MLIEWSEQIRHMLTPMLLSMKLADPRGWCGSGRNILALTPLKCALTHATRTPVDRNAQELICDLLLVYHDMEAVSHNYVALIMTVEVTFAICMPAKTAKTLGSSTRKCKPTAKSSMLNPICPIYLHFDNMGELINNRILSNKSTIINIKSLSANLSNVRVI